MRFLYKLLFFLDDGNFVESYRGHAFFQFFFRRVDIVERAVVGSREAVLGAKCFLAPAEHVLLHQRKFILARRTLGFLWHLFCYL